MPPVSFLRVGVCFFCQFVEQDLLCKIKTHHRRNEFLAQAVLKAAICPRFIAINATFLVFVAEHIVQDFQDPWIIGIGIENRSVRPDERIFRMLSQHLERPVNDIVP